ncbi:helix-turn-helix domain-containing protein [Bacillus licheniformis]|uniref:helix-turn-helix domain-containing protein n=1 Tax=Bacillus licheniformis TaxID=1402 RepID=UPI00018C80CE|nr:helix-turn-helix transcriptional regulator [Bacillus licheniformis]MDH3162352.1 helix-turn-helix transcriptional regulator [Bacillus licheniformis]MED4409039.1 helix-turn-helix transcriptional regulator [Bacillus licheniformis]QDL76909.1 XRE family transcriptional regulator [Bacillus licheniformis]
MKNTVIRFALEEYLKQKNVSQKKLCEETGLRESTLSSMKRSDKVNIVHLATIMEYFNDPEISNFLKVEYEE